MIYKYMYIYIHTYKIIYISLSTGNIIMGIFCNSFSYKKIYRSSLRRTGKWIHRLPRTLKNKSWLVRHYLWLTP